MRRRITLKMMALITCCLSLMCTILSLQVATRFQNSNRALDLLIQQSAWNATNIIAGNFRNYTTKESLLKYNQKLETSNGDVIRKNITNLDNVKSMDTGKKSNETKTIQLKKKKDSLGSIYNPFNFIPNVRYEKTHLVPYLSDDVNNKYLTLPETNYTQRVVILSPIRNAEKSLEIFQTQIINLSYPHKLISVFFGESGSTDKTFEKALNVSKKLKGFNNFMDCRVINLKMSGGIHGSNDFRHKVEYQRYRRSHLAAVRNRLVRYALQNTAFDHVLWIDSDVEEFPTDLVQQMLFAKSDVVAASCLVKDRMYKGMYDCNSWRETEHSLQHQSNMPADALVLECYGRSERIFLPYLKRDGRVVKLDGVGGCALMVKADCFRSGLLFPEVVYKRHIETEGLAKMALDMGYSVVGLPFVEVFHHF
ncbi:uncharacterized protein LOC123555902 [Mercenaria mercenaria]|uniref:uncharacterized protein LOC123555902 n=1 Tax=Mercenaria mercenaria TaxID=6596 RepID=UPI00234F6670|nr:uncharacterized protein LOC123555902 [Mercenaria mercenaria]